MPKRKKPDLTGKVPVFKYRPRFAAIVEVAGEREQKTLYAQLRRMGLTVRLVRV